MLLCACSGSIEPSNFDAPGTRGSAAVGPNAGPGSGGADAPANGSAGSEGGSAGSEGGTGAMPGAGASVNELRCETKAVGPTPLRRLTHAEYDNSVRDLLGDTTRPARAFPPDTEIGLFDNTVNAQTVPVLLAEHYLDAAVKLAEGISDVSALVGCDVAGGASCVTGFVERFGRRAYRRALGGGEVERLVAMYDATAAASNADTAVRSVITAVLASPHFLFRPEFGAEPAALPDARRLTAFELAGRLAALLWASVPDDALLDAAEEGRLQTHEQVEAQARRMLDDERARVEIARFYDQWFGLPLLATATKDAEVYPAFDDALRVSMAEETRRFVSHVLWEDDARLSTLLSASYSFVNAPLAELYGVDGPSDDGFERVTLDTAERRGVLTQASMLTAFAASDESSPVKRGKWVRVRMLCQDLPDPPADVPALPPPEPGVSTRERFAMHTAHDACRGCHELIDGLGFGLEAYDGIGALRSLDHGVPVDASGEVTNTRDIDGAYEGGPELAALLASSTQVRDCAPTQWLRYALGRREERDDTCSVVALRQAFADTDGDLRELMVALTQTDAFFHYRQQE